MLGHLLAELFQHFFAAGAFFQHIQTSIDAAVEADRFAEYGQVDTFDQHQNGDKDQAIDKWLYRDAHIA